MTRSNRIFNRGLLLLLGLVALGAAAVFALPLLPDGAVSIRLPRIAATPTLEWIVVASAVVVAVLAIVVIATRGRGRTSVAIAGDLGVDTRVVDELLRDALSAEPDVIASATTAYRVRRRTVLRIRIEARRGADLRRLTDAARAAVDDLDTALGAASGAHPGAGAGAPADARLPVLVYITSGLRASLAREQRVA